MLYSTSSELTLGGVQIFWKKYMLINVCYKLHTQSSYYVVEVHEIRSMAYIIS